MREDAFTVIKKRTYDDDSYSKETNPYPSSPLIEIANLKDNLESFEHDLDKDDPTKNLPKI